MRTIRTKAGALRQYNAIIARCYRDMSGGTQFGVDMPTLRATWPDRYAEIQRLRALYPTLPDRRTVAVRTASISVRDDLAAAIDARYA